MGCSRAATKAEASENLSGYGSWQIEADMVAAFSPGRIRSRRDSTAARLYCSREQTSDDRRSGGRGNLPKGHASRRFMGSTQHTSVAGSLGRPRLACVLKCTKSALSTLWPPFGTRGHPSPCSTRLPPLRRRGKLYTLPADQEGPRSAKVAQAHVGSSPAAGRLPCCTVVAGPSPLALFCLPACPASLASTVAIHRG